MAGFFTGGLVGFAVYFMISPKYFTMLSDWLGGDASRLVRYLYGLHQHLSQYDPIVKNIAPFVSSGTALLVTPVVSLLTKSNNNNQSHKIWEAFKVSKEEHEENTGFHLIPESSLGKLSVAVMSAGYATFLGGILSASGGFSHAAMVAVSGMVVFFLGGVTRVHCE